MNFPEDRPKFIEMLTKAMGAYGKPLPEPGIIKVWEDMLKPFPLRTIAMAFAGYCDENGEFAPVPAGISKRCKLLDGRPTDEEAWAIALTSRDEEDTVVWTSETAEAFALCSPVLSMGDEVGARMAFKDAYNRLVSQARITGKPASWNVSLGWNVQKREVAIEKAKVAGLLTSSPGHLMLTGESSSDTPAECPDGLQRVKEELARLSEAWADRDSRRAAELKLERDAEEQRKRDIDERVKSYGGRA